MYTSFALLSLASMLSNIPQPSWENDYRLALKTCERTQKPIAVFIGSGSANWRQLTREGQFDADIQRMLNDRFVRVYLDSTTPYGRQVADSFGVSAGRGLVISDRQGGYMAFRHIGELPAKDVAKCLTRYSEADFVVRATETDPNRPAPVAPQTTPSFQYYQPSYSNFCRT
jgi:hypothetical protein